jgi:hypothetical protein
VRTASSYSWSVTRRQHSRTLIGTPAALPERMTAPRRVLPGTTYLVTRRCSERRFFLRPSVITNAIFLYLLSVAARLHRVEIHAFCVSRTSETRQMSERPAAVPVLLAGSRGLADAGPGSQ